VQVIGRGLDVRPSSIQGAGNGLWTTRAFKKHSFVTQYSGTVVTGDRAIKAILEEHKEAVQLEGGEDVHSHTLSVNRHELILGYKHFPAPSGRGGGSYANDGGPARNNTVYHNIGLVTGQEFVVLKATKDIEPDTEVLVSYGRSYWKSRGLKCPK
jgi:hypothetical protein